MTIQQKRMFERFHDAMRRRDTRYIGDRIAEAIAVVGIGVIIGMLVNEIWL